MIVIQTIIAIVAIFALIISICSMRESKRVNNHLLEHNETSITPYCAIRTTNYDNLISVRIENDGQVPLRISKIECVSNQNKENILLFDLLLNEITQKKYHRILAYYADKNNKRYIIPACKNLYIVSITPDNEVIRQKMRDILKNLTINVTYIDSYNKEHICTEKLNVFSLNLGLSLESIENYSLWS